MTKSFLRQAMLVASCAMVALSFGYGLGKGRKISDMHLGGIVSILRADSENPSAIVNIFVNLAKKMVPSVVTVFTTNGAHSGWKAEEGTEGGPNELWRRFFEEFIGGGGDNSGSNSDGPPIGRSQSLGSGFIIEFSDDSALILTNNHVVEGADTVKIKFTESAEERETPAEVVGRDVDLDVALLRVKTKRSLTPAILGDSDKLEQGEFIMAVGNPFGHGHSVTTGVVSAKERALPGSYSQYLQVDAPINPGNSGGPLANLNGEVVGINNAIQANAQGIGFAIPINLVKSVLPQLKTKGHVERGFIGINIEDLRVELAKTLKIDDGIKAPIVTNVMRGTPGEKAGIQAYDVILEVNGKPVHTTTELVGSIAMVPVGSAVKIKLLRRNIEMFVTVEVAKRPLEKNADVKSKKQKVKPTTRKAQQTCGLTLEQIDDESRKAFNLPIKFEGIIVSQVKYGSPADAAGLTRGDIILEVEQKSIKTIDAFESLVSAKKSYLLRIRRVDAQGQDSYSVATLNLTGESAEDSQ